VFGVDAPIFADENIFVLQIYLHLQFNAQQTLIHKSLLTTIIY